MAVKQRGRGLWLAMIITGVGLLALSWWNRHTLSVAPEKTTASAVLPIVTPALPGEHPLFADWKSHPLLHSHIPDATWAGHESWRRDDRQQHREVVLAAPGTEVDALPMIQKALGVCRR